MHHSIKGNLVLAGLVICFPLRGHAQTFYSENFDSGSAGESLTDPQFGFNVYAPGGGDLKLGPSQHGWSGNSVIGTSATIGAENWLYKYLPLPTHGLLEFSADLYSSLTFSQQDIGMAFMPASPYPPGYSGFSLEDDQNGWDSFDGSPTRNQWFSPAGMHDEPITGSLFWNQDTGEHWAEITDGVQSFSSEHFFDDAHRTMAGIAISCDRRYYNPTAGDIDNLRVIQRDASTPEPFTMTLGLAGAGLFVQRRMRTRRRLEG